jgi:hypothetical protein
MKRYPIFELPVGRLFRMDGVYLYVIQSNGIAKYTGSMLAGRGIPLMDFKHHQINEMLPSFAGPVSVRDLEWDL